MLARLHGIYPLADDGEERRHGPRRVVEACVQGGAAAIQLRLKHTPDREALELVRWAVAQTRPAGILLIVNDRYDLADLGGADGVHLGQDDLAPEQIPAALRRRLFVGLSTHTLEQLRDSRRRPIDYVAFGPVFGTTSKTSAYEPRGVDGLRQAVELAAHPVVAIGGIGAANLESVAGAGARAAAVISAVTDAGDPAGEVRCLNGIMSGLDSPPGEGS